MVLNTDWELGWSGSERLYLGSLESNLTLFPAMPAALLRKNCWIGLRGSLGDDWAACAYCEEDEWVADVPIRIAGDSTGVREEARGEVIPELLLCVLGRFGLFVDQIARNGSIGNEKESCSCYTWVFQISGALFPKAFVEIVLLIRRYIFFDHRG